MKVEGITAYQDKITLILSEVSAEPLTAVARIPLVRGNSTDTAYHGRIITTVSGAGKRLSLPRCIEEVSP